MDWLEQCNCGNHHFRNFSAISIQPNLLEEECQESFNKLPSETHKALGGVTKETFTLGIGLGSGGWGRGSGGWGNLHQQFQAYDHKVVNYHSSLTTHAPLFTMQAYVISQRYSSTAQNRYICIQLVAIIILYSQIRLVQKIYLQQLSTVVQSHKLTTRYYEQTSCLLKVIVGNNLGLFQEKLFWGRGDERQFILILLGDGFVATFNMILLSFFLKLYGWWVLAKECHSTRPSPQILFSGIAPIIFGNYNIQLQFNCIFRCNVSSIRVKKNSTGLINFILKKLKETKDITKI